MKKEIIYIDLDGVVVDYYGAANGLTYEETHAKGFFENLKPLENSIEAVKTLMKRFDVYFASTAPWTNVYSWMEKRMWLERYFEDLAFKNLF